MNWEQWVVRGWTPLWEQEMGHVVGWKDPERERETEEEEEGEVDEELVPMPQQEALYAKMEEYDASIAHLGGKAVYTTLDAGVQEDAVMVRPLQDPNRPATTPRSTEQAVSSMNIALGRGSKVKRAQAQQILKEPIPAPFTGLALPALDTWVHVDIHYLHRAYIRGDARFGSPILSRRKMVRGFRNRGITARDITLYQAGKTDDSPLHVDCKGQFLVTQEFLEWLKGERDVWFGDRKHNTLTPLWGTYTPPGAVWVPAEGVDNDLTDHVAAMHAADPNIWTYQRIMQYLHHKIRKAGWLEAGPCKAEPTYLVSGKPKQAPWHGREARYLVLATSGNEAEAYSHVFTAGAPARCYTGTSWVISKHRVGLAFAPRFSGDEGEIDEKGLIVCAMNPTLLSDWELISGTKDALDMEEVSPHALEDALLKRIHADLTWTKPYL
eukprot:3936828-Rhodomonas_salina.1